MTADNPSPTLEEPARPGEEQKDPKKKSVVLVLKSKAKIWVRYTNEKDTIDIFI